MHCLGQRSCRGQPGSTMNQKAQKCCIVTEFNRINPWLKYNTLKVTEGSTRGKIAQKWSMATRHGRKNPWLNVRYCLRQKSCKGQPRTNELGVILLRNALWLPTWEGRTPDHSVVRWWGQSSCGGKLLSSSCQTAEESCMATKIGRKKAWPNCSAMLGPRSCRVQSGSNWLEMHYVHQIW